MQPVTSQPNILIRTATFLDYQTGRTKQAKPYNAPTNYQRRVIRIKVRSGLLYEGWTSDTNMYIESGLGKEQAFAYNKAYARFVSELGSQSASLGATLTAERREAFDMITDLLARALRATRAAKRGDILSVLRELRLSPPTVVVTRTYPRKRGIGRRRVRLSYYKMPDRRLVAKRASSSWLLWSYGISPLLGDIDNATKAFIGDIPQQLKLTKSATEKFNYQSVYNDYLETRLTSYSGQVRSKLTATIGVSNPDLWLLNQLGLINPLQWLNEAVPFSFVIDWASNWSSVINSLTEFLGLSLTNTVVSNKYSVDDKRYHLAKYRNPPHTSVLQRTAQYYERYSKSLTPPTLRFRYERFEWQRGLNAVSLLVGMLPKTQK